MSPLVQQLVVYAAVLMAAGWLLRRWLGRRRRSACERCGPPLRPPRGRGVRPKALRVLR